MSPTTPRHSNARILPLAFRSGWHGLCYFGAVWLILWQSCGASAETVEKCCEGTHVRVAVMPVDFGPYGIWDRDAGELTGYFRRLWDGISDVTGLSYTFVPSTELSLGFVADEHFPLLNGSWDVQIIDTSQPLAFNADLNQHISITKGWITSQVGGLVLRQRKDVDFFQIFQPFESELWLSVIGVTLLSAILVMLVDFIVTGKRSTNIAEAFYHALAMLLGGEDQEWISWPGRVLRLGMLFVVLIVGATYTANLAAFLTRPAFTVLGPRDLSDLRDSIACTSYSENVPGFRPLFRRVISAGSWTETQLDQVAPNGFIPRNDFCLRALRDGTADVFVHAKEHLASLWLSMCHNTSLVSSISILPTTYSFALRRRDRDLADIISSAIATLEASPEWVGVTSDLLKLGLACQDTPSEISRLSLQSMGGLLAIYAVTATVAVLIAIAQRTLTPASASLRASDLKHHARAPSQAAGVCHWSSPRQPDSNLKLSRPGGTGTRPGAHRHWHASAGRDAHERETWEREEEQGAMLAEVLERVRELQGARSDLSYPSPPPSHAGVLAALPLPRDLDRGPAEPEQGHAGPRMYSSSIYYDELFQVGPAGGPGPGMPTALPVTLPGAQAQAQGHWHGAVPVVAIARPFPQTAEPVTPRPMPGHMGHHVGHSPGSWQANGNLHRCV